jgi:DNA polymerase III delta prime subunit
MTVLPTCVDDFAITNPSNKKWLRNCVEGNIIFPSHITKGIILFGAYGSGKTLLANALPIFIEYERASAEDKLAYNFCYDYNGEQVSITPNQQHLEQFVIRTNFYGCGSLRASDVDALVDTIDRDMKNQKFVDCFTNQQFQYFILDEFDTISSTSQQKFKALITNTYFNRSIFIFTTNHIDKVDMGVKSRCEQISFIPTDAEVYKPILIKYVPKVADLNFQVLSKALQIYKGDIRKMIRFCETL